MLRYILYRLLVFLPTLLGVSVIVFLAIRMVPGDTIIAMLGTDAGLLTDTQRDALRAYFGLDRPLLDQYFFWIGEVLNGNFGISVRHGRPVIEIILERFPLTLELAILSLIIALSFGIPVGIMSSVWREKKIDIIGRLLALLGQAVPNFLLGLLILYCLSVYFEIMPNSGNYSDLWINPLENLSQMFLPAITLGFSFAASVMRTTRSSMLEVFGEDYIRTARSKGVSEFNIIFRHALRNALIPVVTLSGVELGYLLGGTLIVEEVYALPGLGRLILNAITQRDYALVQGVTLFIAFNFLILGLLADFIYTVLNRRINFNKV
jgi:peptide/nickel transport system permease protein